MGLNHLAVTFRDRINIRLTESDLPRSWYVWHDLKSGEGSYEPKGGKCDIQTSLDVSWCFQPSNIILLGAHWRVKQAQSSAKKNTTNYTQGEILSTCDGKKDTTNSEPSIFYHFPAFKPTLPFFSLAVRWTNLLEAQVWAAQRPRYYWHLKLISRMTTGGKKTTHNET